MVMKLGRKCLTFHRVGIECRVEKMNPQNVSARHRKSFTLIELLIVIAIIALMASMLLPAIAKSRESAKMIVCQSRLKQLGMAFNMYVQDWDNYFPRTAGWANSLLPYAAAAASNVMREKVYMCPSEKHPYKEVAYLYNRRLAGESGYSAGTTINTINKPTSVIVLYDDSAPINNNFTTANYSHVINRGNNQDGNAEGRHKSGDNFLFVDGHVAWYIIPLGFYSETYGNISMFPDF